MANHQQLSVYHGFFLAISATGSTDADVVPMDIDEDVVYKKCGMNGGMRRDGQPCQRTCFLNQKGLCRDHAQ